MTTHTVEHRHSVFGSIVYEILVSLPCDHGRHTAKIFQGGGWPLGSSDWLVPGSLWIAELPVCAVGELEESAKKNKWKL